MADACYKTSKSAVIQELLRRANGVLGYPKVGKAANGSTNVGGGNHVPDDQVVTTALTHLSSDSTNGNTFMLVTDELRPILDAEKAAAVARIAGATAVSFDLEIAALAEQAVEVGDIHGAVFNPRQIPNCKYWQRADTGITHLANSISEWTIYTDTIPALSVQAVALNKPTWVANDFDGHASVSFDGGDFLHFVAGAFAQASTFYIVARPTDQVGTETLVTTGDDGMRLRFEGANIAGFAGQTISVGPIGATTNIFEFVVSGAQSRVGVNNTGPDPVIMGGNTGDGGIRTGADNAGANGLTGVVFEIIYYTRVLTAAERLVVRKGLGYQYGIQVL